MLLSIVVGGVLDGFAVLFVDWCFVFLCLYVCMIVYFNSRLV